MKQIIFGKEARAKIKIGAEKLSRTVRVTMGGKGRNVLLSDGRVTKDGVTVVRDVELEDEFENKGCQLLKMSSERTNQEAGDGTTATVVVGNKLISNGIDMIENGKDAQELRAELEDARDKAIDFLHDLSSPTTKIGRIATVSANDQDIGDIVAKAVETVGADGIVGMESSYSQNTEIEFINGMKLESGVFLAPFFTVPQAQMAIYKDVYVLLFNGKLSDIDGIEKIHSLMAKNKLIIISHDYDEPLMRSLELTRQQHGIQWIPIKAPIIDREEIMQDLESFTGARIITESDSLSNITIEDFGKVAQIDSTPQYTVLRMDKGRELTVKYYAESIRDNASTLSESERESAMERAARVEGKIAMIKVGASNIREIQEKIDRYKDAISASQSALKGGIVAGGGVTPLMLSLSLGETDGEKLLASALEEPMRQIVSNAGLNSGKIIKEAKETGKGMNVKTGKFEDLFKTGIVDPSLVVENIIKNSVGVAVLALTTEAAIHEIKEKEVCKQ